MHFYHIRKYRVHINLTLPIVLFSAAKMFYSGCKLKYREIHHFSKNVFNLNWIHKYTKCYSVSIIINVILTSKVVEHGKNMDLISILSRMTYITAKKLQIKWVTITLNEDLIWSLSYFCSPLFLWNFNQQPVLIGSLSSYKFWNKEQFFSKHSSVNKSRS